MEQVRKELDDGYQVELEPIDGNAKFIVTVYDRMGEYVFLPPKNALKLGDWINENREELEKLKGEL